MNTKPSRKIMENKLTGFGRVCNHLKILDERCKINKWNPLSWLWVVFMLMVAIPLSLFSDQSYFEMVSDVKNTFFKIK